MYIMCLYFSPFLYIIMQNPDNEETNRKHCSFFFFFFARRWLSLKFGFIFPAFSWRKLQIKNALSHYHWHSRLHHILTVLITNLSGDSAFIYAWNIFDMEETHASKNTGTPHRKSRYLGVNYCCSVRCCWCRRYAHRMTFWFRPLTHTL